MTLRCPTDGRFLSRIVATMNGLDEIVKVEGRCVLHGLIDATNQEWDAEEFVSEEARP